MSVRYITGPGIRELEANVNVLVNERPPERYAMVWAPHGPPVCVGEQAWVQCMVLTRRGGMV